jgi:hypothetical protein
MRRTSITVIGGCASLLVFTAGLGSAVAAHDHPDPAPVTVTTPIDSGEQVGSAVTSLVERATPRR